MTRLAALSDLHGNATALEAVLKDIARDHAAKGFADVTQLDEGLG